MFFFIILFRTFFSIRRNSIFGIWIGIEINLIFFIPLIINKKIIKSYESRLIYFLFQVFFSLYLLYFIIYFLINKIIILNNFILLFPLIIKIGSVPFHFWIPIIIKNLTWINIFIFITWQKIIPIIFIIYLFIINLLNINFLILIIFLSSIIRALKIFNQISTKIILAYSSINQIRWLISIILIRKELWIKYLIFYSIILIKFIFILFKNNLNYLNQIFILNEKNKILLLLFFINLFSLGGMPPFLGFFLKILILIKLIIIKLYFISYFLFYFSLIILFCYIRIIKIYLIYLYKLLKNFFLIIKNIKILIYINFINNLFLIFLFYFNLK